MEAINNNQVSKGKLQLVSRREAANLLSISVRTLDRILADEARFTKYYIKGSVRLKLEEIDNFIQSSTRSRIELGKSAEVPSPSFGKRVELSVYHLLPSAALHMVYSRQLTSIRDKKVVQKWPT